MRTKLPQMTRPKNEAEKRRIYSRVEIEKTGTIYAKETNTVHINGVIDDLFGVSAEDVAAALDNLDESQPLKVSINSEGGSVYEAVAIHNHLAGWSGEVHTHVHSLAASAATIIAQVGDKRTMADNATYMIHQPWTFALGNAKELRDTANMLDKASESILAMYLRRSELPREEMLALMDGEVDGTFLTPQETLDAGLIDEIISTKRQKSEPDAENSVHIRKIKARIKLANL